MKRNLITLLAFSLFVFNANSQQLSIGSEFNFPSGNSSNISAIGVGGFLKTEIALSPKYSLTASGGVSNFFGRKMFGVRSPNLSYVPLKVGFKYYSDESFYVEGQLGAAIPATGEAKTALAWSPGFGTYLQSRNNKNKIEIGLRYEGWTSAQLLIPMGTTYSTFGFIGLRLGYVFGF